MYKYYQSSERRIYDFYQKVLRKLDKKINNKYEKDDGKK